MLHHQFNMYGAILNNNLIAYHEDKDVVTGFVKQQKNDDIQVVKIKKKKRKKILDDIDCQELYLVQYGDEYVPYEYYNTMKGITDQYEYDLVYCKNILYRLLEDGDRSKKDTKAIIKTISILTKEIESSNNLTMQELELWKELDKEYRNKL